MFQKEVADKILAKHRSSAFGRLAVLTGARLRITSSFNISQNCFYPIPKVRSTILVFKPIINNSFAVNNISNLEKITHIFFSKKRKMVNKAFKSLFKNPAQIDISFSNWLIANSDKSRVGDKTLVSIQQGYVSGSYFYVRDEKILIIVQMLIGNTIQRIDKLVYIEG